MKKRLRKLLVLMLVLFAQLQPLQVHALVLDAEQSGHPAGLLLHSHDGEQAHVLTDTDGQPSVVDDTLHESECHPAHTLFSPTPYEYGLVHAGPIRHIVWHQAFVSIDLSLDTPPPKLHFART